MKTRSKFIYALLAGFVVLTTEMFPLAKTEAQVAEVTGAIGTGVLIDQIGDKLTALIGRAEQAGDFLAMRAAQEALFVLDAFERANKNILDTAFEKIGKERQAILNQMKDTIDALEHGRIDTLDKLQAASDQLDRLVRDVAFKKQPVVFRYRGSIVTPGEKNDVRLVINGYRLTYGTPHLLYGGKRFDALKDGENLRFELPRSLIAHSKSRMSSEYAKLVLEGREGGFLGFLTHPVFVEYDLNIVILPESLGHVNVAYSMPVTNRQEAPPVEIHDNYNSSSRGWDCRSFAYRPASSDRRFDINNNRTFVRPGNGNSRGQLRDVRISDTGISFSICATRRITDRDNGYRHADGQYVEVWNTAGHVPKKEAKELSWTKDVVVPVGDNPANLLITVVDFTGIERTVPQSGGRAGRFTLVRYDAQSKVVIATPQIPGDLSAL